MSFLPKPFSHPYEIDPRFTKSVAYFSSEFAIDQVFKIYSGGLGFLAGSHMRSAAALRQNLIGIGILWTFGYYDQARGEEREMAVQYRRKDYAFLQDAGIRFSITIHGHPVWVKALYLDGETFGTVPMFFLTTDLPENDDLSRAISHRLYDPDPLRRIAQYMLLGIGGATLLEELGIAPDVYHLNEAHGLSAVFKLHQRLRCAHKLRERFVFTTHTPEEAGNETSNFELLHEFSFFCGMTLDEARELTGIKEDEVLNHTLAGLRLSRMANGVSKLHGEVARQMWEAFPDICPIHHVTNAQNKKYWVDSGLERARAASDIEHLRHRKRELKARLFAEVADQTGKLFDPDVLTIVWARRFAAYKRADLILKDPGRFFDLLNNAERPVQMIWAGKPYPTDYSAIDTFNKLVQLTRGEENAAVLVRHELALSKLLKDGADIWLNTPIVHREASGTSGMTAAMNGALNLSTDDGWVREFGHDGHNCFLIPVASHSLSPEARDCHDMNGFYRIMEDQALPHYYDDPNHWWHMVLNSMNEVVPFFDADRMAEEYYERIY